jgi:hypothetical protein
MKKYFLIVYCENPITKSELMINDLQSIANTNKVRWICPVLSNSMVIHFSSDVNVSELKELLYLSFCQYSSFFILSELTESDMLGMSQENLEHLLSIDGETIDFEQNPTIEEVEQILEDITMDDEIDSELLSMKLMGTVKANCKIPTLNDLLDKINEQGFNSLTNNEKQLLNNYSKN